MTTAVTEQRAIEHLRNYVYAREQEKAAKRLKDAAAKPLRAHLEANPGELVDGEMGFHARLQERTGQPELDLSAMSDIEIVEAARWGLLRMVASGAADAVTRSNARAGVLRHKYAMPGAPVYVLDVTG